MSIFSASQYIAANYSQDHANSLREIWMGRNNRPGEDMIDWYNSLPPIPEETSSDLVEIEDVTKTLDFYLFELQPSQKDKEQGVKPVQKVHYCSYYRCPTLISSEDTWCSVHEAKVKDFSAKFTPNKKAKLNK